MKNSHFIVQKSERVHFFTFGNEIKDKDEKFSFYCSEIRKGSLLHIWKLNQLLAKCMDKTVVLA
jgi:hypothetical protein